MELNVVNSGSRPCTLRGNGASAIRRRPCLPGIYGACALAWRTHARLKRPKQLVATCLCSIFICRFFRPHHFRAAVKFKVPFAPTPSTMSTTPPFTPEQLAWLEGNFPITTSDATPGPAPSASTGASREPSSEAGSGEFIQLTTVALANRPTLCYVRLSSPLQLLIGRPRQLVSLAHAATPARSASSS